MEFLSGRSWWSQLIIKHSVPEYSELRGSCNLISKPNPELWKLSPRMILKCVPRVLEVTQLPKCGNHWSLTTYDTKRPIYRKKHIDYKPLIYMSLWYWNSSNFLATVSPPTMSSSALRAWHSVSTVGCPSFLLSHLLRRSLRHFGGVLFPGVLRIISTTSIISSWSASASQ